jgi:hypothetical protein
MSKKKLKFSPVACGVGCGIEGASLWIADTVSVYLTITELRQLKEDLDKMLNRKIAHGE